MIVQHILNHCGKCIQKSGKRLRITHFYAHREKRFSHSGPLNAKMDLFTTQDHSKLYAAYRPTYPQTVFDTIIEFCKETQPAKLCTAVDVGCGTGQSSLPLAKHFGKVIGLDISSSQISQAKEKYPDLDFRVGPAEDMSFMDNSSVDLVTVAQAFHWLNHSKFFEEVTRILKPGGSLVVYGYGLSTVDNEEVQRYIWKFYKEVLGDYWESGRQHVENKYKDFSLPFPGWKRNDTLDIEYEWTIDGVLGYISSWSAWQTFLKLHPGSSELDTLIQKNDDHVIIKVWSIDEVLGFYESSSAWRDYLKQNSRDQTMVHFHSLLKEIYPESSDTVTIRWPVFMLMGHKS